MCRKSVFFFFCFSISDKKRNFAPEFLEHTENKQVILVLHTSYMEKSALQKARAAYQPKLPKALQGAVTIKEGAATQSVDNQEEIKKLFPNTYERGCNP